MNWDTNKYKVYTWKNWIILHWIINPGLAINELFFGQRIPKVSLVDKTSLKSKFESSYVPCPHCNTLHDYRTWSSTFGTDMLNWFGLYCPNCGGVIPCVMNLTSYLILGITFPLWIWFKKLLKNKWLAMQPKRYKYVNIKEVHNPFDKKNWLKTGMQFGVAMFILITILLPYIEGNNITAKDIGRGLIIWTIGGLIFGLILKIMDKKPNTKYNKRVM